MADPPSSIPFNLAETDRLLSTTRAVRKRLDLDRQVEPEVLMECIRLSQQAPTGSNTQGWRWVIVTDPAKRAQLGELYRAAGTSYLERQYARADEGSQLKRVMGSAVWLAQNIEKVPVHVIPCIEGRLTSQASALAWAGQMGSIFPAVWSFQLALRSRGLGTVITSLHLASEEKVAELLGIPDDVMQVALLPVAYTKGTEFRPAERPPPEAIVHWDSWGNMRGG